MKGLLWRHPLESQRYIDANEAAGMGELTQGEGVNVRRMRRQWQSRMTRWQGRKSTGCFLSRVRTTESNDLECSRKPRAENVHQSF